MRKKGYDQNHEQCEAIKIILKQLWDKYDKDQNMSMDIDECRTFIFDLLHNIG